jgi:hypothetical protein
MNTNFKEQDDSISKNLKVIHQKLQYQAGALQELAEDGYKLQV